MIALDMKKPNDCNNCPCFTEIQESGEFYCSAMICLGGVVDVYRWEVELDRRYDNGIFIMYPVPEWCPWVEINDKEEK